MKHLIGIIAFLALLSCDSEKAHRNSLQNTKWKGVKATYNYPDGSSKSYSGPHHGAFVIAFNDNNEFVKELSPYYVKILGKWSYSASGKKLRLTYKDDSWTEYDVLILGMKDMTLYQEDALVGASGPIDVTTELILVD